VETQLERIARIAKDKPNEKFTSLIHLINKESIIACHKEMNGKKAGGEDKVTKEIYEAKLEENVEDLISRMKRQAYKPQPARRVNIPKPGTDKLRPLGIPAYEDKLVQAALAKVLNAIYEQDFMECSFGFRPNRGCHDAIKLLNKIVNMEEISWVVDADIKGFFDNVNHEWLMKFIEHRIEDFNLRRLIIRMLKAGVVEAGVKYDTPQGTPQGGVASPIFGNIYLHYVIDLWFEVYIRKHSKGKAYMVRYADDSVFCFEYEEDARIFYNEFRRRLAKFGLEVAQEKTKIIEIVKGDKDDRNNGNGDGNSFDFLGFTHYVTMDEFGRKQVKQKTSKKKYKASMVRCKEWIKRNRTVPIKDFMKILNQKIQGHINYYGITGNWRSVGNFVDECRSLLFKWLNRRSQKKSFDWNKFVLFIKKYPLPKVKIYVNIYSKGVGNCYLT